MIEMTLDLAQISHIVKLNLDQTTSVITAKGRHKATIKLVYLVNKIHSWKFLFWNREEEVVKKWSGS